MSKWWTSNNSWGKNECKKLDFVYFFSRLSLFFDTFFALLQNSKKATISFVKSICPSLLRRFCLPVCPRGAIWLPLCGFSWNLRFGVSFENMLGKFKPYYNVTRPLGILHEDLCAFMIRCCWILLRMRNVSKLWRKSNHSFHAQRLFPKIVPFVK